MKPILIERLFVCPHCGLATQIDNFSEVNGLNTIMDYKTGRTIGFNTPFQLAINKHVLKHLGYRVDRTWAVHIQDSFGYPGLHLHLETTLTDGHTAFNLDKDPRVRIDPQIILNYKGKKCLKSNRKQKAQRDESSWPQQIKTNKKHSAQSSAKTRTQLMRLSSAWG